MGGATTGGGAKGIITPGTADEGVRTTGVTVTTTDDTEGTAIAGGGATPGDTERSGAASLTSPVSLHEPEVQQASEGTQELKICTEHSFFS